MPLKQCPVEPEAIPAGKVGASGRLGIVEETVRCAAPLRRCGEISAVADWHGFPKFEAGQRLDLCQLRWRFVAMELDDICAGLVGETRGIGRMRVDQQQHPPDVRRARCAEGASGGGIEMAWAFGEMDKADVAGTVSQRGIERFRR